MYENRKCGAFNLCDRSMKLDPSRASQHDIVDKYAMSGVNALLWTDCNAYATKSCDCNRRSDNDPGCDRQFV